MPETPSVRVWVPSMETGAAGLPRAMPSMLKFRSSEVARFRAEVSSKRTTSLEDGVMPGTQEFGLVQLLPATPDQTGACGGTMKRHCTASSVALPAAMV
jgi:hypothetical protein